MNRPLSSLCAIVLFAVLSTSHAYTYHWRCSNGGNKYSVRVDDTRKTFEWKGEKYKAIDANAEWLAAKERSGGVKDTDDPPCAKGGWRVTGKGRSFLFCYTTQGGGFFDARGGKDKFLESFDCQCAVPRACF